MKNKGFTLIELLVTITIMFSLLGIAVISFIKISDSKKEKSYELVKNQVVVAAEEYFESNKYLFEGLSNGSTGIISVGKLVDEGYLNKVINPVTGNPLNYCNYVEYTKNNNKYSAKFKEEYLEGDSCDTYDVVKVVEPGAPKINLSFYKQGDSSHKKVIPDSSTGWFNINSLGENNKLGIYVSTDTNKNGEILEIQKCFDFESNSCVNYETVTTNSKYEDTNTFGNNDNLKTVCFKAINKAGKSNFSCLTAKVDTIRPVITMNLKQGKDKNNTFLETVDNTNYKEKFEDNTNLISYTSNTWTNKQVMTLVSYSSDLSGYKSKGCTDTGGDNFTFYKRVLNTQTTGRTMRCNAVDNAGNAATQKSVTIKRDTEGPDCTITLGGITNGGNKVGDVQWYIKNNAKVTFNINVNDAYSKVKGSYSIPDETDETKATSRNITVYDNVGNSTLCKSPKFGIEKSVTISLDKTTTNNAVTNNQLISEDKKVFDTSKGACGYGTCSNTQNYCYRNSGLTEKCGSVNGEYFAKSCQWVVAHTLTFDVSAISYNGTKVEDDTDGMNLNKINRSTTTGCGHADSKGEKYYYKTCGNSGGATLISRDFKYTSPAGNESNTIRLITSYTADCGYPYPY